MNQKRDGVLIVLACHCVFDVSLNRCLAEHPADGSIYEAQLFYALRHLDWRANKSARLAITGAATKKERTCSESRSYVEKAVSMNLKIGNDVLVEEYALTSVENLLLSIYAYHLAQGFYPERIDVISWEFKRDRFERTLEAISNWAPLGESWQTLNFFPVGDLYGDAKANALLAEREYIRSLTQELEPYYENPMTQSILKKRDVHCSRPSAKEYYSAYPLPF